MPIESNFDQNLLLNVISGDQRAFCRLFDQFSPSVYAFAKRVTRSSQLAEDIVQDIFMKIWINRESLEHIENFPAYLNRMTRNKCLNTLRRISMETTVTDSIITNFREETSDMEDQIDFKDSEKILNEALEELTPQQRLIYTLCYQDGKKYKEVATELNISPGTVHSHLKQALKTIRTYYKKHSGAYSALFVLIFH